MKISWIGVVVAVLAMTASAAARGHDSSPVVGHIITSTSGVLISRAGKLIAAKSGQSLFRGDRVITSANARAKFTTAGCNVSLAGISIITVNEACVAPQTLYPGSTDMPGGPNVLDAIKEFFIEAFGGI